MISTVLLVILKDINAKKDYDKAYVNRFIAVMYATKGDNEKEAISYLKKAVAPDILNEVDHGDALKLLGDLQMQTKDYKGALALIFMLGWSLLAKMMVILGLKLLKLIMS